MSDTWVPITSVIVDKWGNLMLAVKDAIDGDRNSKKDDTIGNKDALFSINKYIQVFAKTKFVCSEGGETGVWQHKD